MPCTYCHNTDHTLRNCTSDITSFIQQFRDFIAPNPYALRQQYLFLNNFSKPVLTLMYKHAGGNNGGNKFHIVSKIVKLYFERYSTRSFHNNDVEALVVTEQIYQAFEELRTWITPGNSELQAWCLEMRHKLDAYHTRRFGTSIILTRFLMQFQSQLRSVDPKAHLQKLNINITVNPAIVVQECFMCCDENKSLAEFGCGHSYCTDCILNTAKSRTKSVIKCAVCREDIAEMKVGTEELRATVCARLAEE